MQLLVIQILGCSEWSERWPRRSAGVDGDDVALLQGLLLAALGPFVPLLRFLLRARPSFLAHVSCARFDWQAGASGANILEEFSPVRRFVAVSGGLDLFVGQEGFELGCFVGVGFDADVDSSVLQSVLVGSECAACVERIALDLAKVHLLSER